MKKFGLNLRPLTNQSQQSKGFQYADKPSNDFGLLFVFNPARKVSFHMKNVLFPIEIGFFDENWKFIGSKLMQPEIGKVTTVKDVKYAIEALPGWVKKIPKEENMKSLITQAGLEVVLAMPSQHKAELQRIMDTHGLTSVLEEFTKICQEKATHMSNIEETMEKESWKKKAAFLDIMLKRMKKMDATGI